MRFIVKASFYFISMFVFASSCSTDEEDCGCNGSTYRILENQQARYSGNGAFIVPDSIAGFLQVLACNVDPGWEVSKDEKSWNYAISGNIRKRCLGPNPELAFPRPGGPTQITYIKKN